MTVQKGKHAAAVSALFIIGNTVVFFPLTNIRGGSIIAFLIAVGAGVPLFLVFSVAASRMKGQTFVDIIMNNCRRPAAVIILLITAAAALASAMVNCRNHVNFVDIARLPDTPKTIVALLFLSVVFLLSVSRRKVVYKLALAFFIVIFISIVVLFLLSLPNMHISYIRSAYHPDIPQILREAGAYLSGGFVAGAFLLCYIEGHGGGSFAAWFGGFAAAAIMLAVCLMNTVLVFSEEFMAQLEFPYMSAMSVISLGSRFSRLEGFSYIIFYICALFRVAVLIAIVKNIMRRLFGINEKLTAGICCALSFAFTMTAWGIPDFILNDGFEAAKSAVCILLSVSGIIIKKARSENVLK